MKVRFVVSRGSIESSREKRRGWRKVSDCLSPYDLDQYQGRSDASYQVKVRVAVLTFHNLDGSTSLPTVAQTNEDIPSSLYVCVSFKPCGLRATYDMYYETMVVQQRQTLSVSWSDFTH